MVRILSILFLCLPCFGQIAFTYTDQPFLQTDTGTPGAQLLYFVYDADALGLNDGDPVSVFTDQGIYHNDLLASGTERPYWTNDVSEINGEGWLFFDGVNDAMSTNATFIVPNPYHVIMVARLPPTAGAAEVVFGGFAMHDPSYTEASTFVESGLLNIANASYMSISDTFPDWMVYEYCVNGMFSYARTNNVLLVNGTQATNRFTGFRLSSTTFPAQMKVAYCSLYTNALTDDIAGDVVQSLGSRFGITTYARDALPSWDPTTNASLLSLYDLSIYALSNRTVIASIPDMGPNAYNLRVTNSPVYESGPTTNFGRGFVKLRDTSDHMMGTNFTTLYAQPTTIIMVMEGASGVNGLDFYLDNATNVNTLNIAQVFYKDGPTATKINAGTEWAPAFSNFSPLRIWEVIFNGASSSLKSNNVQIATGNTGSNGRVGIAIAGARNWDPTLTADMNFWWAGFYTNTLSVTERSNIYYYLGKRYSIPVTLP